MMHLKPYTWKLMHQVLALGACLLQEREGINYDCNEIPDNATPHAIALPAKAY